MTNFINLSENVKDQINTCHILNLLKNNIKLLKFKNEQLKSLINLLKINIKAHSNSSNEDDTLWLKRNCYCFRSLLSNLKKKNLVITVKLSVTKQVKIF